MVESAENADPVTVSVKAGSPAMVYAGEMLVSDGKRIRRILDGVGRRGHGARGITAGDGDGLQSFRRGDGERA